MLCRVCKREIADNSIFCNWCGSEQLVINNQVQPKRLKSGEYSAQVMINGQRITIKSKTKEQWYADYEYKKGTPLTNLKKIKLGELLDRYINDNENILSPSSIRGYKIARRNAFKIYMNDYISNINWQEMIKVESYRVAPKTLKNEWGLVSAALGFYNYQKPNVHLPEVKLANGDFLDADQIQVFINSIKGDIAELPCLLALHSLTISEIKGLTKDDIKDGYISVNKVIVPNADNKQVLKLTTKKATRTREVPILIDRVNELLEADEPILKLSEPALRRHILKACKKNNLPLVSIHDLRRSFASLCFSNGLEIDEHTVCLLGGWSVNSPVVHKVYTKISAKDINEDTKKLKEYFNGAKIAVDISQLLKTTKS